LGIKELKPEDKPRSWLFYGRAGTGKTTLAASFPKPLLVIDIDDKGTDSISDLPGIKLVEPTTFDELTEIYWYLKENPTRYKTVVIDTISQVNRMLVNEISGDKARNAGKAPGDWGTMKLADWGKVAAKMKNWITDMRNLPIEMVFLAQDRVFNLDEENEEAIDSDSIDPEVGPRLSNSVASHICAAVHVIGNTFIREVKKTSKINKDKVIKRKEYCIRLGPSSYYITKLRKPKSIILPDFVSEPSYKKIMTIIKGEN